MSKKDQSTQQLLDAAKAVQQHSYSPYSNFKVGAAILGQNQQIFSGCNVENASYPMGQCAEGSAITAMISQGCQQIEEVLIVSPNNELLPPCGGCRQKLKEFASEQTKVHLATAGGEIKTLLLSELLPHAFNKQDLL